MLGHSKRSLYVTVYLATGIENAVNQIMNGAPDNSSSVADLSNFAN